MNEYAGSNPLAEPYQAPNRTRQGKVLLVHDGDSCHVEIDLGCGVTFSTMTRFAGINAPELATPAGPPARDFLISLCSNYQCFNNCAFDVLGRDKYGRALVVLWGIDSKGNPVNLNQAMLDNKQAVPM